MKAIEFQTRIRPDGKIDVPDTFFKKLQHAQMVRVIVLISEPRDNGLEEQAWTHMTAEQFLSGYGNSDSVYDQT